MTHDVAHYQGLVDTAMAPHRWILCGDVAAVFTPVVDHLREIGAPRPLLLAGSEGTGNQPDPEAAEVIVLGTSSDTMLGGIRAYHAALRSLPQSAIDRIEAWDPDRTARVLASFLDTELDIAGRPSWAARPLSWLVLEDKLRAESIWEAAGVAHAGHVNVAAVASDLVETARSMDRGDGTVWAGDDREGWNGGAEYGRIVVDPDNAHDAIDFFTAHCDRVRVMPFLTGVPCSIHGMVFPDTVTAFRPVEMIVFRSPGSDRFRYSSVATTWDPTVEVRAEMRVAAQRVGAHLREAHDFRGAFTMDGVATVDGWLPTELNPRFGAGLGSVGRSSGMPLLGISRLLIEGQTGGLDPVEVETIAVEASDRIRQLGGLAMITVPATGTHEQRVEYSHGRMIPVAEGGHGMLELGPSPMGGLVRLAMDPGSVLAGTFGAPVAQAGFALADELWDTGIGPLIPATPA